MPKYLISVTHGRDVPVRECSAFVVMW